MALRRDDGVLFLFELVRELLFKGNLHSTLKVLVNVHEEND